MSLPSFRPMPATEHMVNEDGTPATEGALIRAHHRMLMRLRWRSPELRAEDKKEKRLPADWHTWMGCDAEDGYGSKGCTCDTWTDASKRQNNAPRRTRDAERALRERLRRELQYTIREREEAATAGVSLRQPEPNVGSAVYVKTIDTLAPLVSMPERSKRTPHGTLELSQERVPQGGKGLPVRGRAAATKLATEVPGRGGRRSGHWAARAEKIGSRVRGRGCLRLPSWLSGARRYLSAMRLAGSPTG
jgi:hypothetical protein